jgi:putative transposase
MPNYRRFYSGNIWFFTVVTHRRIPVLTTKAARKSLRTAINQCREIYLFAVEAWVLLPDHLHCIWDLPECDLNYSRRWAIIKRKFTQAFAERERPTFWQNRFWAHLVTDEKDYENQMNYIHYNPVKHGLIERAVDWPWTSLHRLIKEGRYLANWGESVEIPEGVGRE